MMGPVVSEIAEEKDGTLKVGKVNVDEEEDLASQYGIMSIPCLLLFEKGKVINKNIGFIEEEKLREFIK